MLCLPFVGADPRNSLGGLNVGIDPRKRGLRALFEDWQKSLQLKEDEVVYMHWTMLL